LHWQQEHNESLVPIFQLSDLVGYSSPVLELAKAEQHLGSTRNSLLNPALQGDSRPLILLRCEAGLLGLEVDQIIGEQELVIRPVGTTIMPPPYVYGCSILGDGRLTLVIDGVALAKQSLNQALLGLTTNAPETQSVALLAPAQVDVHRPPYLTDQSGHPDPNQKCLLVIDDSVTLRQTLTLTLQNAGYQVLQAQDGLEAIAQLQQHQEDIQLITCDIEMPRLNGFEFLMRYSQEPALAKIPVVMLTSRSSEKHRQLALELGAAAYLTKPYVEQELLATITDLIKPAAEICTDSWRS
jgi:chemotaxis family two-component system sensor histidine kinase/response regulator PixL